MTIGEKVVGTAYSGQVYDVICMGSGNMSNFTLEVQGQNGAWTILEPIVIHGYNYYVVDTWKTSDIDRYDRTEVYLYWCAA